MKIFKTIEGMRIWSQEQKRSGKKVAFVPTMGALHEGHLSLIREAKNHGDAIALSIYINPAQFSPAEDMAKYPRDLDGDLEKAEKLGMDAVFLPTDEMIYPHGFQTYVTVEDMTKTLCGASRPTHFRGVATVVAKLFNIVTPDAAIFGEKDYQQLVVIKRLARDLNMPIEIIGCPIVREPDGIAMSSRNSYLSDEERIAARSLSRSLGRAHEMINAGEIDAKKILGVVKNTIEAESIPRLDYARLVDANTLEEIDEFRRPALLAIAAFIGKTRLIDNRLFSAR